MKPSREGSDCPYTPSNLAPTHHCPPPLMCVHGQNTCAHARTACLRAQGPGPWSEWSVLGTAAGVPPPPSPPTAAGRPTSSSLAIKWQPPLSCSGAPVTGYVVQVCKPVCVCVCMLAEGLRCCGAQLICVIVPLIGIRRCCTPSRCSGLPVRCSGPPVCCPGGGRSWELSHPPWTTRWQTWAPGRSGASSPARGRSAALPGHCHACRQTFGMHTPRKNTHACVCTTNART